MQTRVYLRPPRKVLEQHGEPEVFSSPLLVSNVTHKTIRGADLHIVKSEMHPRDPERILDNESAGFVDRKGLAIIDF
jgi:threonine dehydrogenase-like Zn-dependent dehydrogenase